MSRGVGNVIGVCEVDAPNINARPFVVLSSPIHFIPTSSSWLNLVERWFGEITRDRIRRGTFERAPALVEAIEDYL